jgi:hypothetical protein
LKNRRKPKKPDKPMPRSASEAGSGTAEKLPEMFDVKAANVLLTVIAAGGITFVKASDMALGGASGTITSDANDVTPRGDVTDKVRLVPEPKAVAPLAPTFPAKVPER